MNKLSIVRQSIFDRAQRRAVIQGFIEPSYLNKKLQREDYIISQAFVSNKPTHYILDHGDFMANGQFK